MNTSTTTVLLERQDHTVRFNALCFQSDYDQLLKNNKLPANTECMDESIARILYPQDYLDMVLADLPYCIGIWIETLFKGQKDYKLEANRVHTNSFIIHVRDGKLIVATYLGCCAVELSRLLLFIKDHIGNALEIEIIATTKFSHHSAN